MRRFVRLEQLFGREDCDGNRILFRAADLYYNRFGGELVFHGFAKVVRTFPALTARALYSQGALHLNSATARRGNGSSV
jgi:hypothetical protein